MNEHPVMTGAGLSADPHTADIDGALAPSPASRIGHLNDAFRRTFIGGRVMLTRGVAELPDAERLAIAVAVRAFDAFTPDNDPHGEHDFGAIEHRGERYFWKIDVYDTDLRYGSPDATDPAVTTRVLTIMRADEY